MHISDSGTPSPQGTDAFSPTTQLASLVDAEADWNTVTRVADATSRNALTAPELRDGVMAVQESDHSIWLYNGTSWQPVYFGGLVPITPTSVAGTGVTLSGNVVSFSAATSVSLNGCFTSAFADYQIEFTVTNGSVALGGTFRLRAGGADLSTGTYSQQLTYNSAPTTLATVYQSSLTAWSWAAAAYFGHRATIKLFSPAIAVNKSVLVSSGGYGSSAVTKAELACLNTSTAAYDGITFLPSTGNFTGTVRVYGLA